MKRRILIAGYYGFGNLGDEAILECMLRDLRALHSDFEFVVVSGNPDRTQALHTVQAVDWRNVASIVQAARECELIVVGGGGLFQDYWRDDAEEILTPWHSGIAYYSGLPHLAHLVGRPCMMYGIGIGPLRTEAGREQTRRALDLCQLVTVRDPESLALVRELGVRYPESVRLTADPGFGTPCAGSDEIERALQGVGADAGQPLYGVSLRYWDFGVTPEEWERAVARALDAFLDQVPGTAVLLPFQHEVISRYEDDVAVSRRIWRTMERRERAVILEGVQRPTLAAGLLARCRLVLGMRLHAVEFALNAGASVVNLAYDPKTASLMDAFGLGHASLAPQEWNAEAIAAALSQALEDPHQSRAEISARAAAYRERASESARTLVELLEAGAAPDPSQSLEAAREFALNRTFRAISQERLARDLAAETERQASLLEWQSGELAAIKQGAGWRWLQLLWGVRLLLAPRGSRREKFLEALKRGPGMAGVGRAIRRLGLARRLSWPAYSMDRYQRERSAVVPTRDVSGGAWPCEPGLVSVVLPAFNGAGLLEESVNSILAQSYTQWELIAIDDGSTDDTGVILDRFAQQDSRIRVIHQENLKIPRTLSRGFEQAKGEYHTWTSCDNRMHPDFLQRMVDCLRRHPSWDMAYANLDIIGEAGERLVDSPWYAGYQEPPRSGHVRLPDDPSELNVWANNYVGAAFLYRARVTGLLGRYSPLRYTAEDYDYWMRVNELMNLRHADFREPVYDYRFHSRSLTSQDEELGITRNRERLMVFDDFRRDFCLGPLLWCGEADGDDGSQRALGDLHSRVTRLGHAWVSPAALDAMTLPRRWQPLVYVKLRAGSSTRPSIPDRVPDHALKVLVVNGREASSEDVSDPGSWDLCVVLGGTDAQPALGSRWHGWIAARDADTLLALLDVRCRSKHLAFLEDDLSGSFESPLKVSIIVCTYRRGAKLSACLDSVAQQRFPRWDYEVIVVNNDPADEEVAARVEEHRARWYGRFPDHLRLVESAIRGLSHARNAGLAEARGEVVCFIDDDAIADPDWLDAVWSDFEADAQLGVLGGAILVHVPTPKPGWLRQGMLGYWSHFDPAYSGSTVVCDWWEFPWGANWSARREALYLMGGFRTRYGRRGAGYGGGEEVIAARLAQRLGFRVAVDPRARVAHDVDAARFTRRHVWRTIQSGHRTWHAAQRDLYLPMELGARSIARRLGRSLLTFPVRAVKNSLFVACAETVAELRMTAWAIGDQCARFRRPVSGL